MKSRKPTKARNLVVLGMLLTRKGGAMRDRRLRRPLDARVRVSHLEEVEARFEQPRARWGHD